MAKPQNPTDRLVSFLKTHGQEGTGAVKSGSGRQSQIIPCSIPTIDFLARRGGMPTGRMAILTGEPGTGKTTVIYRTMANAIAMYDYPCLYIDSEGRYEENIAEANGIPVADQEHFFLSQYEPPDPRMSEDEQKKHYRVTAQKLPAMIADFTDSQEVINAGGGVIALDCINDLMADEFEHQQYGGAAGNFTIPKIFSQWGRELGSRLNARNVLFILVVQVRGNVSMGMANRGGSDTIMPGGWAIQFNNSLLIEFKKSSQEKVVTGQGKDLQVDYKGTWIRATALKATAGGFGSTGTFLMTPKYGPDIAREVAKYGKKYGLLRGNGSWYIFDAPEGEVKLNGVDKLNEYLMAHPDLMAQMCEQIRQIGMGRGQENIITEGDNSEPEIDE